MESLKLQGEIRKDPEGYQQEFLEQLRHYRACLQVLTLRPNEVSKEFTTLVRFVASVSDLYPAHTQSFIREIIQLLETGYAELEKGLRKCLVQSLMQLRNKKGIELMDLLPLFFRLFKCKDKSLRSMIFTFLISDLKSSTKGAQNQPLSRQMKGFLLKTVQYETEVVAKKALAILTDLWRRQIWHDVHTANVIASALEHPNTTVMYATVKFFLGYDLKEGEDEEDSAKFQKQVQLNPEDVYKAQKKGTRASKKRKMKQLKRVKAAMMKEARKNEPITEQFAAIQLLQDPYKVAEILFKRLRNERITNQARNAMIQLLSRVISVHQLVLLNFYPYLQKYLSPSNRDVLVILAALVQSCHEMVPPDVLEAPLKQLVDQFVHDRARPEMIVMGLKTVREMCSRSPLVMNQELLSDLVLYKNFKNAEVKAAAKGLISLFRDSAPQMLSRKDRGRAGMLFQQEQPVYGQRQIHQRIKGAELLEKDKEQHQDSLSDVDLEELEETESSEKEDEDLCSVDTEIESTEIESTKIESAEIEAPLEMRKILDEKDFERLDELKREQALKLQLKKFGLLSESARSTKLMEAAEADAEEMLKKQEEKAYISETKVDPVELQSKKKKKATKSERVQSILRGREETSNYESKTAHKKRKTGGLSNKEKIKRKSLPLKGRMAQAKKRRKLTALKRKGKNFKGHIK